jgi:streptogramin lyase
MKLSVTVTLSCLVVIASLAQSTFAQSVTEFPLTNPKEQAGNVCYVPAGSTQNSSLSNLALQRFVAADGFVWFTDAPANSIGRMDPFGNITKYAIPTANSGPVGCAFGPSDGLLYFAEQSVVPAKVATLDPASDPRAPVIREFPMPAPNDGAAGVVFDANGILNIMNSKSSAIHRMRTNGTFLSPIRLAAGRWPHGPALCGGKVIFAENTANRFASLTTAGVVVEKALPQANSKPFAFTCGGDGMAYGTENGVGKIVKVNPATTTLVKQFAILSGPASAPMGIGTGFDGNLYFANSQSNTIGKLTVGTTGTLLPEIAIPIAGALPNKVTPCFTSGICFSQRGTSGIGVLF